MAGAGDADPIEAPSIEAYSIKGGGLRATVLNYGGRLHDLRLTRSHDLRPEGELEGGLEHSLVLGYPVLEMYRHDPHYLGAVVGPVANRISGAKGWIGDERFCFDANEACGGEPCGGEAGVQTLHGGRHNLSHRFWQLRDKEPHRLVLTCEQGHGVDGFPGHRCYSAEYRLGKDGGGKDGGGKERGGKDGGGKDDSDKDDGHASLTVTLRACSDRTTAIDMTMHPYFNLDGFNLDGFNLDGFNLDGIHDIRHHILQIASESYLAQDAWHCATGAVMQVKNSAFDFTHPKPLAPIVEGTAPPIDHYFCRTVEGADFYAPQEESTALPLARLSSVRSPLMLEVFSSAPGAPGAPGLQCYLGQGLTAPFAPFAGLCLEPHAWPNALNHAPAHAPAHFPSVIIDADTPYQQSITYRFIRRFGH